MLRPRSSEFDLFDVCFGEGRKHGRLLCDTKLSPLFANSELADMMFVGVPARVADVKNTVRARTRASTYVGEGTCLQEADTRWE